MTKLKKIYNSEDVSIKAPPAVVHIKHSITLRQYKLWIILLQRYQEIFQSGEQPDENGFYSMDKSEIDNLMGYEYRKDEMRRDFLAIRKEPIELNYIEKGGTPVIHGMGFISEYKVTLKRVRFILPSFLKQVMQGLDQPKAMFQLINWEIFNHFTGKHEAVIYKLCRDYMGICRTPYMTIAEFRQYMGLKDGEHPEFKHFKRRIIDAPVSRINESTLSDISIEVEYIKDEEDGRKTKGLIFHVSKKHQQMLPFIEFEENPAFKFAKITIKASDQTKYLATHAPEEIALCIERANEYGEQLIKKGKIAEYGAIYRKAITEGWHEQYKEQKALAERIEQDKKDAITKAQQAKTEADHIEQTKKEQGEKLWAEFQAMPEAEQKALIERVCIAKPKTRADYIKHGLNSGLLRGAIIAELKAPTV